MCCHQIKMHRPLTYHKLAKLGVHRINSVYWAQVKYGSMGGWMDGEIAS